MNHTVFQIPMLLIRHGETMANRERRYCGTWDIPLSPQGREQILHCASCDCVRRAAEAFAPGVPTVYVSPLIRAKETAQLLFPHGVLVETAGFAEMNFGVFERRSAEEMRYDHRYLEWVDSGCMSQCPGGESRDMFQERVCRTFLDLPFFSLDVSPPSYLIIVGHGGTVMALCSRFIRDISYFDVRLPNGGMIEAVCRYHAGEVSFTDLQIFGE